MKKYTVFYKEGENTYPIYFWEGDYWLGGNNVEPMLFDRKADAEHEAMVIRKRKIHAFREGKIFVSRCKLEVF